MSGISSNLIFTVNCLTIWIRDSTWYQVRLLIVITVAIGFGLAVFQSECSSAREKQQLIDPQLVLQRFNINKRGDLILVPLTFAGKTYQFFLDTGADITIFDHTLPLGLPAKRSFHRTPDGIVIVPLYTAPRAFVGKLPFQVRGLVADRDLTGYRTVSGYEIYGVLGLDFLSRHVIHIDFDRGELMFLKSAGRDLGKGIPIAMPNRRSPTVTVDLTGLGRERFILDTGTAGYGSGVLKTAHFDELVRRRSLKVVGSFVTETLSGTGKSRLGLTNSMTLGEFQIANPVFGESRNVNTLGLNFWSRFKVSIDFPNQKLYLQKGKFFKRSDRIDRSGLHLIRKRGQTIVESVDKGSAADKAGIRANDVLLNVADAEANKQSLFELREVFTLENENIELTIQRDETEIKRLLKLKE